jgi:hypothetical protein
MNEILLQIKTIAKDQRWQLRRKAVQRKYGREVSQSAPVLFANAIPKAGSHLLIQILWGMCQLGPFVDSGRSSVNRDEANRNLPIKKRVQRILELKPGDIGYGKIACAPPFIDLLTQPGIATAFIYRDPRDLAISNVHYATKMHPGHHLHQFFNQVLKTDQERLRYIITGEGAYKGLRDRYLGYIGWLQQPVCCLKFEDLRSANLRMALGHYLDFVAEKGYTPSVSREEALDVLEKAIQPSKSGTFRKGTSGQWKAAFSPEIKDLFKETMGDLLIELGYEEGYNW